MATKHNIRFSELVNQANRYDLSGNFEKANKIDALLVSLAQANLRLEILPPELSVSFSDIPNFILEMENLEKLLTRKFSEGYTNKINNLSRKIVQYMNTTSSPEEKVAYQAMLDYLTKAGGRIIQLNQKITTYIAPITSTT